jgi:hypothetical protein
MLPVFECIEVSNALAGRTEICIVSDCGSPGESLDVPGGSPGLEANRVARACESSRTLPK